MMSIIKKTAVYGCTTLILLNSMVCISLNAIHNMSLFPKNKIDKSSQCQSKIADRIMQHLFGETAENDDTQSTTTAKAFARNPCVLTELASNFDVHRLQLIASKQYDGILDDLNLCKNAIRKSQVRQSVFYLEGDENSYADAKYNALQVLDRSADGFFLICSDICASIMLEIADTLGFGVDNHMWITTIQTTTQLVHTHRTIYPQKLITVTFIGQDFQKPNDSNEFIVTTRHEVAKSDGHIGGEGFRSKQEQFLMKLVTSSEGEWNSIFHPSRIAALAEKPTLRVATINYNINYERREDIFNHNEIKCHDGLLC